MFLMMVGDGSGRSQIVGPPRRIRTASKSAELVPASKSDPAKKLQVRKSVILALSGVGRPTKRATETILESITIFD
jgi:hypothetical protein